MSNHNYSQYSKKYNNKQNKPKQTETNIEPVEVKMEYKADAEITAVTPVTDVVVEPVTEPTSETPKTIEGVVVNCAKLNVRAKPSITGEVLCVLNASSEIEINIDKSTSDWFSICTATGVEGYCMRQFVEANM